MNHVNTSDWYNSLRQELESNSLSIEKVSRRSEYWRKSNLDIVSDFVQDTSQIDLSQSKGTCLFEPDLTIHGDIMKLASEKSDLVSSIMDVIADEESFAKNYFGRLEEKSQKLIPRPLARDNSLSPKVGYALSFSDTFKKPLVIHNKTQTSASNCFQRNLIVVKDDVEGTIIETGNNLSVFNSVTEIYLGKNAKLNFLDLTGENNIFPKISHKFCDIAENATFNHFGLRLNTKATRTEIELHLNGQCINTSIANVSLINKLDHFSDENVLVNHNAYECKSRQVFKSVLENDCTSIVRGKIYVAPEAQKTDGYQSSRSLLLNENSKFFCKPELEIYADDVICSHGSTSSSLDRDSLFYLLSRGVQKNKAKEMLVTAFISEALDEIEDERIRAALSDYIDNWISSFF